MSRPTFTTEQLGILASIQADVEAQLAPKPRRLTHTLGVADTAAELAEIYGVDIFEARAASLLHDWYKVLTDDEMVGLARREGIDMGVDLELVSPLLHGICAARDLPARYPELPAEVFRAIGRHTVGATDMSPLDMVVFVADGIEPNRPASKGIVLVRESVGTVSLKELFWRSFSEGIVYVLRTGRYLYPGTLDIYNGIVLGTTTDKENG